MQTRYPATAFEQLVLKAVRDLDGQGDDETIRRKISASGKTNPSVEDVRFALAFLEEIGYISSSLVPHQMDGSGESTKIYEIGVFGERALASAPIHRPEHNAFRNRLFLTAVLAAFDRLNSFFNIDALRWPVRIAFGLAATWLLISAVQVVRIGLLYENLPSSAGRGLR